MAMDTTETWGGEPQLKAGLEGVESVMQRLVVGRAHSDCKLDLWEGP